MKVDTVGLSNEPFFCENVLFAYKIDLNVNLHVPGEIANKSYAKFWGVKEMYCGISASRELKVLYGLVIFYLIFYLFYNS